jgi:D-alanine-D-alanine ligase
MKVTVLYGGPSNEREISLRSGEAVIKGLRAAGHEVFGADISPSDLSALDRPNDVVFPVLHGQFGESGELQEILEQRGLAFVGSGSKASRLGMDKVASKEAWAAAGLTTPKWKLYTRQSWPTSGNGEFPVPCVVKPVDSGSSIGVFICQGAAEAKEAIGKVVSEYGRALVEQFIRGPELTVGLLEERPLAPIRIVPKSEFFDYKAKYVAADTEHRFDTGLPAVVVKECQELARKANEVIGARDLGRIDIMVEEKTNRPYLLEINTIPGFTSVSLLPDAARHEGISFEQLVDRLVKRARGRHQEA